MFIVIKLFVVCRVCCRVLWFSLLIIFCRVWCCCLWFICCSGSRLVIMSWLSWKCWLFNFNCVVMRVELWIL